MEIHDNIRVKRDSNPWTQEEMADKLSMSANGYANIERGKTAINLDKLKQIADIFNIDIVELLANQDKTFFFSIGDHNNSHNGNGATDKLQALLDLKDELLEQKNNEIAALKQIIQLLQQQIEN